MICNPENEDALEEKYVFYLCHFNFIHILNEILEVYWKLYLKN
jgi:hypothetical protein